MTSPVLGFVGLGLMGARMSARLLAAGHTLHVWNRDPAKAAPLAEQGARLAPDLGALAAACDVVMLCVSDTAAVETVVAALAPSLRPGALVVDFSSIAPDATRRLAASLAARGVGFVDCPVSGGVRGAEAGTLVLMAGGEPAHVERLRPLAAALGQRLTHVGGPGAGQVVKIANQMIVACNAAVLAEVVALAERAGADARALPEALAGGFADSLPFRILAPRMAARDFEKVEWRVKTLAKDLRLASELSGEVSLPMVEAARALYARHATAGHDEHDPSTLVLLHAPAEMP